jgi:hypothetical protein
MPTTATVFGGGVAGYRSFLIETEGAADPIKFQLERREQFFAEFDSNRPQACYRPDREVFARNMRRRRPEPGLDPRMLWLLATAKLNQAERFGVGLGEVYGKDQDKFDAEPERLYVQLQEHYHTRILADVVSMFDLPFPTIPPPFAMRTTIRLFVALPHEWTLQFVGASEIVGCVLFRAMRDKGVELFADDAPVARRIRSFYNEILADEVGHVGFIAAKLSSKGRAVTRFLARHVAWRAILGSAPEVTLLFGPRELRERLKARFDVEEAVREFPGRAYGAAVM